MENDPIVEFEEIMELLRQLVNNDSRIIPLTEFDQIEARIYILIEELPAVFHPLLEAQLQLVNDIKNNQ